jgi:Uma2 family endonuclease
MMAEPVLQPQPMTFQQAARLDPDVHPGEVVDGEWIPVTRSTYRHGEILINAGVLLKSYARQHPGWIVSGGDPGTKLRRTPDTLRGPDVAILKAERRPIGKGEAGWLEGAPEVAVEVISDSQSVAGQIQKALDYLQAGAEMVWLLDPEPERLLLVTPPNQIRILGPDDTLDGGETLPGFACAVREFFE